VSETRGKSQGRVNLDAALREWPSAEKPQKDWEDRAQSVVDRLRRGERGATVAYVADAELLADPLGQTPEDGHNSAGAGGSVIHPPGAKKGSGTPMTMTADRERDRRSLKDLAKMASGLTPPPPSVGSMPSGVMRAAEAKADDSGIVDLAAAAAADPGAAARAQSTPLASHGLFDDEPVSQRPPMSGPISAAPMSGPLSQPAPVSGPASAHGLPQQPVPSVPPPPVLTPSAPPVGLAPSSVASVHPMPAKKKGSGATIALVVGGLVALSAAAAGTFLYMKSQATSPASEPVAMATTQPATPAAATPDPTPAATTTTAEAKPVDEITPTPATEPSLDPNALPAAAPPSKTTAKNATSKAVARASTSTPTKAQEPAPAPKEEAPPKLTEKDLVGSAPSDPAGDLGTAMKKVVGDEPEKTPAAATTSPKIPTGNVPQKPSQGAVTGALGAVLPQARACLGPDDPISRASVVFSSDGTVQRVKVSGGAVGKPAEACIKNALMKAKLQPFAEPTYTANITVRHP